MPSRALNLNTYRRTFYVRFRGATTGRTVTADGNKQASYEFCRLEGVPWSSLITVCRKPTPGVVYRH